MGRPLDLISRQASNLIIAQIALLVKCLPHDLLHTSALSRAGGMLAKNIKW